MILLGLGNLQHHGCDCLGLDSSWTQTRSWIRLCSVLYPSLFTYLPRPGLSHPFPPHLTRPPSPIRPPCPLLPCPGRYYTVAAVYVCLPCSGVSHARAGVEFHSVPHVVQRRKCPVRKWIFTTIYAVMQSLLPPCHLTCGQARGVCLLCSSSALVSFRLLPL